MVHTVEVRLRRIFTGLPPAAVVPRSTAYWILCSITVSWENVKMRFFAEAVWKSGRRRKKDFTNAVRCGILLPVFDIREHTQMVQGLLTSVYFFFYSFTYFTVGKAYLGFTDKRKFVCLAA